MSPRSADDGPAGVREQVLSAAFDEVTRWGIERFSAHNLVAHHGIDEAVLDEHWPNEQELLMEVLLEWPSRSITAPDTGTLLGDLTLVASAMAGYISTPAGRSLQGTLLIGERDVFRVGVRTQYWQRRAATMRGIFDRARQRHEMRSDVDPNVALQMLVAPINMRVLFTNVPADDEYCRTMAELVCRAIAP